MGGGASSAADKPKKSKPKADVPPARCLLVRLPTPLLTHVCTFLSFTASRRCRPACRALRNRTDSLLSLPSDLRVVDNRAQIGFRVMLDADTERRLPAITRLTLESGFTHPAASQCLRTLTNPAMRLPALRFLCVEWMPSGARLCLPALETLEVRWCHTPLDGTGSAMYVRDIAERVREGEGKGEGRSGCMPQLRTLILGWRMEDAEDFRALAAIKLDPLRPLALHIRFPSIVCREERPLWRGNGAGPVIAEPDRLAHAAKQLSSMLEAYEGEVPSRRRAVAALAQCPRLTSLTTQWNAKEPVTEWHYRLALFSVLTRLRRLSVSVQPPVVWTDTLTRLTALRSLQLYCHSSLSPGQLPFSVLAARLPELSEITIAWQQDESDAAHARLLARQTATRFAKHLAMGGGGAARVRLRVLAQERGGGWVEVKEQ